MNLEFFLNLLSTSFSLAFVFLKTFAPIYPFLFIFGFLFYYYKSKFDEFGIRVIVGEFGAGKTYFTFLKAYFSLYLKTRKKPIIIANIPYPFIDIFFQSKSDFFLLCRHFKKYMLNSNDVYSNNNERPILFIVDEMQLYFFSENHKEAFSENDFLLLLTQLRKRKILMQGITQELGQIVKRVRVLTPYVEYYTSFLGFIRRRQIIHFLDDSSTSIKDEEITEVIKTNYMLAPGFLQFLNKYKKDFSLYQQLSYYVVDPGNDKLIGFSFEQFLQKIDRKCKAPIIAQL